MNVGIIGTGMMGSQIALRLAQKGHGITVFNRDRSKSEKLRKSGLTVAEQPSEIGHYYNVALICVKDYEAVSDVSFEKNGLIENPNNDLIVLQCSTISPDESNKVANIYSSKGIKMVSPYSRGSISGRKRGIDTDYSRCKVRIR